MNYEAAVMGLLVANGNTFVSPQYPVGGNLSCPDYIAIRPALKQCFIVEVSTGWDLKALAEKVRNREKQWFSILQEHFFKLGVCEPGWSFQVIIFVRSERIDWFKLAINNANDVHIWPLEITLMPWLWPDKYRHPDFSFNETKSKISLTLDN
jgi:hypothetical protein